MKIWILYKKTEYKCTNYEFVTFWIREPKAKDIEKVYREHYKIDQHLMLNDNMFFEIESGNVYNDFGTEWFIQMREGEQ